MLPVNLRNEVENNAKRSRFDVSKATKCGIKENTDFQSKVKLLKEDILNAPCHVFGEHAKYDESVTSIVTRKVPTSYLR